MNTKLNRAFKFKLKTNEKQEQKLIKFCDAYRFVYNKALELVKSRLNEREAYKTINNHIVNSYVKPYSILTFEDMVKFLPLWKRTKEYGFLAEAPSNALQQSILDLYHALNSAFKKNNGIRFPKFKKKGSLNSIKYPQNFNIEGNRIRLEKTGWFRFYKSQDIEGKPKQITVKQESDGWYAIITTEIEKDIVENLNNPVGLDVGVNKFVTLSNGDYFAAVDVSRYEKRKTRSQRQLARKQIHSKNYQKQKEKLQKHYKKITNIRKDYQHKVSHNIVKKHGLVVIEDLNIKSMTRSAKGTIENPGYNVKYKTQLNKSIQNQGWATFFQYLEYKLIVNGGKLIKADPVYTSQTCPACGHISKDNRKTQATFYCQKCNYTADADLVAATNILRKGLGKTTPLKILPQGLREVTPVEYVKYIRQSRNQQKSLSA